MPTAIVSIESKGRGGLQVTTTHPNASFRVKREDLQTPHSFKQAMIKNASKRPVHPCFGDGLFVPATKGGLLKEYAKFLGEFNDRYR